jgi:hypothetical protein
VRLCLQANDRDHPRAPPWREAWRHGSSHLEAK